MGLNPEIKTSEVLIKVDYRLAPGISDYRFFKDFVERIKIHSKDEDKGRVLAAGFQGINYGYLQLTPPVKKVSKPVKKRKKLKKK